jgi:hypothetical protein
MMELVQTSLSWLLEYVILKLLALLQLTYYWLLQRVGCPLLSLF